MQLDNSFKTVLNSHLTEILLLRKGINSVFYKYSLTMEVLFPSHRKQSNHHLFFVCLLTSTLCHTFYSFDTFIYFLFKVRTSWKRCKLNSENMSQRVKGGPQEPKGKQFSPQAGVEDACNQELVIGSLAASYIHSRVKKIWANTKIAR